MSDSLVIGWWGLDVRILRNSRIVGRDIGEGEDAVAAILKIIDGECPGKGSARIIYQPDTLETHEVRCPKTDRRRLRKILAADFPALDSSATVWSAEPIRAGRNGYGTLLYLDTRPRLAALSEGLRRRGFRVEGAWPLFSLVDAVAHPSGARESMNVVATARRAVVVGSTPGGDRFVLAQEGNDIMAMPHAVRHALARFEENEHPAGWLVVEDGPTAPALRDAAAGFISREVSMTDFLSRAQLLIPGGLSDFIPRRRFFWRPKITRQIATAIGIALLAGTATSAWEIKNRREQSRRKRSADEIHRRESSELLLTERALHSRVEALSEIIAHAESKPQFHYRLLLALARAIPDTMALRTITTEGPDFVITGRIDLSAIQNPLAGFTRDLARPDEPWRIQTGTVESAGGEFTLRGSIEKPNVREKPEVMDALAREAALRTQLAEICAYLPSTSSVASPGQPWGRSWIVDARSTERFSGLEVCHYTFTLADPQAQAWQSVVETVKMFCDEPGLTIDRLTLAAGPEESGSSLEATITATVRLRR